MVFGRNDKCWCGSNLKYKNCHYEFDEKLKACRRKGYEIPKRKMIKTPGQIEGIRKSAVINNGLLDLIEKNIKPGMSTEEINTMAHEFTISHGGIPADLNYEGFPKSICTSVNDQVCHGIPSKDTILKEGDIINCDATTILNGYYSDSSRMFMIGEVSEKARKLVTVTKQALNKAVEIIKPWETSLGDIGRAIGNIAEENGYSVVREFGGHGVGLDIHEDPFVYHYKTKAKGMILVPGMVFTIEPMINEGSHRIFIDADNEWTVYTDDGSLSAQWEYTIAINEDGAEIIAR